MLRPTTFSIVKKLSAELCVFACSMIPRNTFARGPFPPPPPPIPPTPTHPNRPAAAPPQGPHGPPRHSYGAVRVTPPPNRPIGTLPVRPAASFTTERQSLRPANCPDTSLHGNPPTRPLTLGISVGRRATWSGAVRPPISQTSEYKRLGRTTSSKNSCFFGSTSAEYSC